MISNIKLNCSNSTTPSVLQQLFDPHLSQQSKKILEEIIRLDIKNRKGFYDVIHFYIQKSKKQDIDCVRICNNYDYNFRRQKINLSEEILFLLINFDLFQQLLTFQRKIIWNNKELFTKIETQDALNYYYLIALKEIVNKITEKMLQNRIKDRMFLVALDKNKKKDFIKNYFDTHRKEKINTFKQVYDNFDNKMLKENYYNYFKEICYYFFSVKNFIALAEKQTPSLLIQYKMDELGKREQQLSELIEVEIQNLIK